MLRLVLSRLLLAALPFAGYWLWRQHAIRTGRPMGSTPWGWLFGAGGVIVALSLIATVLFHEDNRREVYVPAQVSPDGHVDHGHFDKTRPDL